MKTKIVYVLIASSNTPFLEELWASVFSLRQYHPEVNVTVLVDEKTSTLIDSHPSLKALLTEIMVVDVPKEYSAKQRSRQIKTTVRHLIRGNYLFIDTDTIIARPLDGIDQLNCNIAAVPDCHSTLANHPFSATQRGLLKHIFEEDFSECPYEFNSGVMYVADNEDTRIFYSKWNENWTYSCFKRGNSQDQPALTKTDKDMGYIIQRMPDEYNAQIAISLQYFNEGRIIHFWHMEFLSDQSYSPFLGQNAYFEIKKFGGITPCIRQQILNCKSAFETPTMVVGKQQIYFLFSPTGMVLSQLRSENQRWAKFMDYIAVKVLRFMRMIRKIKKTKYNEKNTNFRHHTSF